MAHFYGTLRGSRGEATRTGTKQSGLTVIAASWQGAVRVDLQETEAGTQAHIQLIKWHGSGIERTLYSELIDAPLPLPLPLEAKQKRVG